MTSNGLRSSDITLKTRKLLCAWSPPVLTMDTNTWVTVADSSSHHSQIDATGGPGRLHLRWKTFVCIVLKLKHTLVSRVLRACMSFCFPDTFCFWYSREHFLWNLIFCASMCTHKLWKHKSFPWELRGQIVWSFFSERFNGNAFFACKSNCDVLT